MEVLGSVVWVPLLSYAYFRAFAVLCYCVFCLVDYFAVALCCVAFYAIFVEDFSLLYHIVFVMGVLWFSWGPWPAAGCFYFT